MIDVIIPAYDAHSTIDRTLESIEKQINKDKLKVYIIDDYSEKDYDYLKDKYDLDLTIMRLDENHGPGFARQYGINHSNNELIVFIDADDIFLKTDSIKIMIDTIKNNDVGVTAFMEEFAIGSSIKYEDNIWMHGKIYRRKYLVDNNIHFNDSRQNEDYGFNRLLILSKAKIGYDSQVTYVWKNNMNSITRKNSYEYNYLGLFGYMYNVIWVLEESIKRNYSKTLIGSLAYEALTFMYINYVIFSNNKDMNELNKKCKIVLDIYNDFKLSQNEEETIYKKIIKKYYHVKLANSKVSFDDFLNNIL